MRFNRRGRRSGGGEKKIIILCLYGDKGGEVHGKWEGGRGGPWCSVARQKLQFEKQNRQPPKPLGMDGKGWESERKIYSNVLGPSIREKNGEIEERCSKSKMTNRHQETGKNRKEKGVH